MSRLNNYIREAIRLQDRAARRLAMSEIDKMIDFFTKHDWDMPTALLGALLNVMYKNHRVSFTLATPGRDEDKKPDFDYIAAGQTLVDGSILVYLSNNAGELLSKAMKGVENPRGVFEKGQFFKELIDVFSHELVHREQWKRAGEKWLKRVQKGKTISVPKYLSAKVELTAWAHDAALAFIDGDNNPNEITIYKEFFGIKHPIFKRFMKKFADFITQFKERKKGDSKL
jgi:hypothetical protein